MLLELIGVVKSFGGHRIIKDISLGVSTGEIVGLLGPSGCGKTTLLRIIAGLETADAGHVLYRGRDMADVPVYERGFGMVFQDFALFPHKDVAGNVEFGLRMQDWDAKKRRQRLASVLELVGLGGYQERAIHQLSGGEQQRVALARSLAPSPGLLLLDEPMGSLDRALRDRLMREVRLILKEAGSKLGRPEGITAIFVTHDQEEAFAIADRVMVMNAGRIDQVGTPVELHRNPKNVFVARFLGLENLLDGKILSNDPTLVATSIGVLQSREEGLPEGTKVTVLIRPDAADINPIPEKSPNDIEVRIVQISFRGRYQVAIVDPLVASREITQLKFEFDTDVSLPEQGSTTTLYLDAAAINFLRD